MLIVALVADGLESCLSASVYVCVFLCVGVGVCVCAHVGRCLLLR